MPAIRTVSFLLSIIVAASAAGASQAHARAHAITFRDIEFDYPKDDRVAVARQKFGAELPVGTPIAQAEAILKHADARCRAAAADGRLVCTFGMNDAPYNQLHDILWTIRLSAVSGRLSALAIDRQSFGS